MKGLNIYYKVLAAASVVFLVFFPFVTRLYAAKPVGMELEYFAKKSKVTVDLFYYHKEVLLFLFAVALLAALAAGAVFSLVIQEKFPVKLLPGEKAVVLAGGYFLLNVIRASYQMLINLIPFWPSNILYQVCLFIIFFIVC